MAIITCAYSTMQFRTDYFSSLRLGKESKLVHPVFFLPLSDLTRIAESEELEGEELHLLTLALLHATQKVGLQDSCKLTQEGQAQAAKHLANLANLAPLLATSPLTTLPKVVFNQHNQDLTQLGGWLSLWSDALRESKEERARSYVQAQAKDTLKTKPKTAANIAAWASVAFEFPQFLIEDEGKLITISDYWQGILTASLSKDTNKIHSYPLSDLAELRDHVIDYIHDAPKWGVDCLCALERACEAHANWLGFGAHNYVILGDGEGADPSKESQSLQTLQAQAPAAQPIRQDYATDFAHRLALMAWRAKNKTL